MLSTYVSTFTLSVSQANLIIKSAGSLNVKGYTYKSIPALVTVQTLLKSNPGNEIYQILGKMYVNEGAWSNDAFLSVVNQSSASGTSTGDVSSVATAQTVKTYSDNDIINFVNTMGIKWVRENKPELAARYDLIKGEQILQPALPVNSATNIIGSPSPSIGLTSTLVSSGIVGNTSGAVLSQQQTAQTNLIDTTKTYTPEQIAAKIASTGLSLFIRMGTSGEFTEEAEIAYQNYLTYVSQGLLNQDGTLKTVVIGKNDVPSTSQSSGNYPTEVPLQGAPDPASSASVGTVLKAIGADVIDKAGKWIADKWSDITGKTKPTKNTAMYKYASHAQCFQTGTGRFIITGAEASALYIAAGGTVATEWSNGIQILNTQAIFKGIVFVNGFWYDANMFSINAIGQTGWDTTYQKYWTDAIGANYITSDMFNDAAYLPPETGVSVTAPFKAAFYAGQTQPSTDPPATNPPATNPPATGQPASETQSIGGNNTALILLAAVAVYALMQGRS